MSARLEGGVHVFESRLERDCQILFDPDHRLRFCSQPETFRWRAKGRARRWTPDMRLVDLRDEATLYVEIKPAAVVARHPDFKGRLAGMVEQCADRGAGFALLCEGHIRGPALEAAKLIRAAAARCDDEMTSILLERLSPLRLPMPLGAIQSRFPDPAQRFALLGLLVRGHLGFLPERGLGSATIIEEGPHQWR